MRLADVIRIARGEQPADLVLRNARLVNVFSGQIERTDIAIAGERSSALGLAMKARQSIDLAGAYVAPGLIDAHVHIESSMATHAPVRPRGAAARHHHRGYRSPRDRQRPRPGRHPLHAACGPLHAAQRLGQRALLRACHATWRRPARCWRRRSADACWTTPACSGWPR